MRTLRVLLAGTVTLALLGGLGGAAVAQADAQGSGHFTMESSEDLSEGPGPGGTMIYTQAKEASDPRLSGTWTEIMDCRERSPYFFVCVGSVRVENEGGTWLGRLEGFGGPSGDFDMTVLEGQGGYAGLTALRHVTIEMDEMSEEGVILDFEMPTQPEPPAE